jgi:DNA replication protein DnaC
MPRILNDWDHIDDNPFLSKQLAYNRTNEQLFSNKHCTRLNAEQCFAYQSILEAVHVQSGQTFFLNGPAGTGKTFVYQTLCHHIRTDGHIVPCVMSSGVAAILLPGGHTAHSMFAIPVDSLSETSVCNINKNSKQAVMLRHVSLIIWDEAAMQHWCILIYFHPFVMKNIL